MKFNIDGYQFDAESCVDGIFINPKLPKRFDDTDNSKRPDSHQKWWYRTYIMTDSVDELDQYYAERKDEYAEAGRTSWVDGRKKWLEAYPTGVRFMVRCLDGGAWDRSTNYGFFGDSDAAIQKAKEIDRMYNE